MRKENYKEEVNFTEEQIKIDRRRDPAIDYSYDDKRSIFRKISKSRAEKKMHKEGHVGYKDSSDSAKNYSLGDYYNENDYYNESDYYSDEDSSYSNRDYNTSNNGYNDSNNKSKNETFNKAKSWVEKNASQESKDFFESIQKEYKNIRGSIENKKKKESSNKKKKSKSGGYKKCKNCGAQMYSDAKVCPKCGEEQKKKSGFSKSIFSMVGKLVLIIVIINVAIGIISYFVYSNDKSSEPVTSEPYIELAEYKKEIPLKYIVNPKDVIKTDKEVVHVGDGGDIPAGEYLFVKNDKERSFVSVEVYSILDKENAELYESINRNYYLKLDNGDTVNLDNGTLYRADQVELDMTNDENKKSGMYRIGKDIGDTFKIEGNSQTYFAVIGAENDIIVNGFVDEGELLIDPQFIEDSSIEGENAKYIFVSGGIINPR